jgi:alkanesulfonate monooxygenase SsuD/methylene tetrahydromethanopterin reductase-like flavin-dependent oxidoreductase (luciferase family)
VKIPLSVLDIQWPGHLPQLVPALDQMGFHRYWVSEHHSASRSASPTVLTALAAGLCERMRIGPAGILLRLAPAPRVAQDFAALSLYFPGRIDLGIAGALPPESYLAAFGQDVVIADNDAYLDRVRRLVGLVRSPPGGDSQAPEIGPRSDSRAELWLCGTSLGSARLAGALGVRFAYHHYLGILHDPNPASPPAISRAYRESFSPFAPGDRPYLAVAGYGACASSHGLATDVWHTQAQQAGRAVPVPTFLGDAKQVGGELRALAESYSADELVIDCFMPSLAVRLESLGAIAHEWQRPVL